MTKKKPPSEKEFYDQLRKQHNKNLGTDPNSQEEKKYYDGLRRQHAENLKMARQKPASKSVKKGK